MPGSFDSFRQLALVRRADSADPPGQNLSPFRDKMTEEFRILVIYIGYFFGAKFTHSLAPYTEPLWTCHNYEPFCLEGSDASILIHNFMRWMKIPALIRHPVKAR